MSKTGFANGSLSPTYYFEDSRGHIVLPVYDAGKPEQARKVFAARFENQVHYDETGAHGPYMWKEATTWGELRDLEQKLIRQETFKASIQCAKFGAKRQIVSDSVRANLRHRMTSADCSNWERDFIKAWFALQEEKREKYEASFMARNYYLWSREMDSGTTIADRMPLQPGEFWRNE